MSGTSSTSSERIAIQFDRVSKYYSDSIGLLRYKNYLDRLKNGQFFAKVSESKPFYALNDVSFRVMKKEKVGFIGRNGAGKSTTLKLIGGISVPNAGSIHTDGRIGGVLELGSGFNGELTARDNIYLQGSIYGFSEQQMSDMIPEIISIADLGQFLDVQLKRYSSGMKVRLGFAVALTASPEIVLLDEVMAVGDAAFRKKSLELMEQFLENKTVFFVSHSMKEIRRVCQRVIVLDHGAVIYDGPVAEGVDFYNEYIELRPDKQITRQVVPARNIKRGKPTNPSYKIQKLGFGENGKKREIDLDIGQPIEVNLVVTVKKPAVLLMQVTFSKIMLNNLTTLMQAEEIDLGSLEGEIKMKYSLDTRPLTAGPYKLSFTLSVPKKNSKHLRVLENAFVNLKGDQPSQKSGIVQLPSSLSKELKING